LGVPYKDKIMFVSLYNGKVHKIPFILNKDFLYFAGLIAGDGDIRKSGSTYSVRFSNKEQPLHSSFVKVVSEQFSLPFNIQKGNKHRPQATRTHSKILAQILFALGIPLSPKSHSLALSPTLLHLHNTLLCHYIAGLYDTDGSVCIRKTKGSDCIDLTTCSEQLARQLQLVFLRFDIHAKIRSRKPSGGAYNGKTIQGKLKKWILEVRGIEEIKRFAQSIPLRHPDKKKKLDDIIQKNVLSNTNKDIIPTIGNRIRHVLQKHHIPLRGLRQKRRFSRQYLQRMLLNVKIDDDELDNIKKIVFSDIFWEKIVSIKQKKTPYKYVYDLTVQDSHNFVVDGVLVHNTAAVVRDEFLAGWSLEAGAMVLSNKGILMIDEMDKMTDEDRSAMHEGMEQQTISISKANIQATLRCETTILAAANPKFGRFDPYETISRQINLPPALINRFDLIFTIKDLPDQERDTQLADFILHLHKKRGTKTVSIDTDTLRKYLIYARQEMSPHLTEEALVVLNAFFRWL
jgi:replicative DNA helicase Mcm